MITEVVTTDTVPGARRLARAQGALRRRAVRRGDRAHPRRRVGDSSLFDGVDPTHAPPRQRSLFDRVRS